MFVVVNGNKVDVVFVGFWGFVVFGYIVNGVDEVRFIVIVYVVFMGINLFVVFFEVDVDSVVVILLFVGGEFVVVVLVG